MPALAPAALAISVVLSALGAVVLCILVVLYGFTPAGEEPPGAAARRLLVTRIGHAIAAVCFTATAILISVILAQPPRPVMPPAAPADARVPALGARLEAQESRLTQTEARLDDLDRSLRREAEPGEPAAARAVESPPPPAPKPAVTAPRPAPSRPSPPTVASAPPARRGESAVPTPPAAALARPAPAPSMALTPLPSAPRPAPPASVPPAPLVIAEPAPAPEPSTVPDDTESALAAPRRRPIPPVSASAAPPRRSTGELTPPGPVPASPPRFDLLGRLRDDWNTIRRGVQSGEDDFRRALDDTRRNVKGLLGQ